MSKMTYMQSPQTLAEYNMFKIGGKSDAVKCWILEGDDEMRPEKQAGTKL